MNNIKRDQDTEIAGFLKTLATGMALELHSV